MTFFHSPVVREDLEAIFSNYKRIAKMSGEIAHMDHTSKIAHINETRALIDKQHVFYARLVLASTEDEEALHLRSQIDKLTNSLGYANMNECVRSMTKILDDALKREILDHP